MLKVDFCDTGCAMRVFKRSALRGIFPFNGLHRFLPVLVHGAGGKAREVAINHRPRTAGVSKYGLNNRLWRGIADLFAIAWYQKRRVGQVQCCELADDVHGTSRNASSDLGAVVSADSSGPRTSPRSHTAGRASAGDPGTSESSNLEPSFA